MSRKSTYLIPSRTVTAEQEIKKSRFITTAGHASDKAAAMRFVESVRKEHPSAHHNCYAYIAGSPFDTTEIGFSDDGEVNGTAGKPILSVLQHKGIGEIVTVVTRYFGGIRLGTGGLVRAYTGSVTLALDVLPLKKLVTTKKAIITVPYQYENAVRLALDKFNIAIEEAVYTDEVLIEAGIPEDTLDKLADEIMNATRGAARIKINKT
ncbi:MAG: YigZ family protein [Deltaproteobacteria bacterium]